VLPLWKLWHGRGFRRLLIDLFGSVLCCDVPCVKRRTCRGRQGTGMVDGVFESVCVCRQHGLLLISSGDPSRASFIELQCWSSVVAVFDHVSDAMECSQMSEWLIC